jgi:hypothetical protein
MITEMRKITLSKYKSSHLKHPLKWNNVLKINNCKEFLHVYGGLYVFSLIYVIHDMQSPKY